MVCLICVSVWLFLISEKKCSIHTSSSTFTDVLAVQDWKTLVVPLCKLTATTLPAWLVLFNVRLKLKVLSLFSLLLFWQAPRGSDLRQRALRMPRGHLRPGNEREGRPGFRECFSYRYVWVPSFHVFSLRYFSVTKTTLWLSFFLIQVQKDWKNKCLKKKIKPALMGCWDFVCKTNKKQNRFYFFFKIIPRA